MKRIIYIIVLILVALTFILAPALAQSPITSDTWFKETPAGNGGDVKISDSLYLGYTGTNFSTAFDTVGRISKYGGSTITDDWILKGVGGRLVLSAPSAGIISFTDGSGFDGTVTGSALSLTTTLTQYAIPYIGASGQLVDPGGDLIFDGAHLFVGPISYLDGGLVIGGTSGTSMIFNDEGVITQYYNQPINPGDIFYGGTGTGDMFLLGMGSPGQVLKVKLDGSNIEWASSIDLTSFSATSPIFYDNLTGIISSQPATYSQSGYITTTDQNIAGSKRYNTNGHYNITGATDSLMIGKDTGTDEVGLFHAGNKQIATWEEAGQRYSYGGDGLHYSNLTNIFSTYNDAFSIDDVGNLIFEGISADGFETTLTPTDPTADRTITFPDASGTVALAGDAYTDEKAQDAIGLMLNAGLTYTDGTPLLAISDRDWGDITSSGSGLSWVIDNLAITNAKINDVAIGKVTGLGTGVATWLATPSSANLRSALTDENGSGVALFDNATSATFVTPTIGAAVATSVANSTANNCKITFASTGFQMTRNIADNNTLLELNQSNASSTGRLIDAQLDGTTKFQVQYTGSTVVFKNSNDATHALKVSQSHASATGTIFTGANSTGDVFTITQPGKIGLYNGTTTTDMGVPIIVASGSGVNQTASITGGALYSVPASKSGLYRITFVANVTTVAGTSCQLGNIDVNYTENISGATVKSLSGNVNNYNRTTTNTTTGGVITCSMLIDVEASTNITFDIGYASVPAAAMNYKYSYIVELLKLQ